MTLSAAQRKVELALRQYRAVVILAGGLPKDLRDDLDEKIASVPHLTKKPLQELQSWCEDLMAQFHLLCGFKTTPQEYLKLVEHTWTIPDDLVFITKAHYDKYLFQRCEKMFKKWPLLPPHTRIGIDPRGTQPRTGEVFEWRLLEAALFEDVAVLWNECVRSERPDGVAWGDDRIPKKRFRSLQRATARAVFALLEGYINGVAVDIQSVFDLAAIAPADRELLLERAADGRQRFKRFREKVLQYPKIAVLAQHPPINGENPDLALVLRREREWRDFFMHPSPRLDEPTKAGREREFFDLELSDLGALIDATISLIREIDKALEGRFGSVSVWLFDRRPDGTFPNETFH